MILSFNEIEEIEGLENCGNLLKLDLHNNLIRQIKNLEGKEKMVSAIVIGPKDSIRVYSGKKPKIIRPYEFENYMSERGKRGRSVPPFKKIDSLEVEPK